MAIIDNGMLARQYGVAIDQLEEALRKCPDELWEQPLWADQPDQWVARGFSAFWYLGYHALFWIDLYLTGKEEGFAPPAPFDLVEMQANETLPRVYTRAELLGYLDLVRRRCNETIAAMTSERAREICRFPTGWEVPFGELQLYAMRHTVEHAAQLGLFLGQRASK
jgi:hypothetical protein